MKRSLRQFWTAFAGTLAVAVLVLHFSWAQTYRQLPLRPPLWLGGASFLSDYGSHGSTAHYLFRFGLFGMRDRLLKSDLLFLGSSHVEFGVSAARLTSELSRRKGRPVRAYNLGSGFGDGIGFAREVIAANDLRDKTVVLDLFSPMGEGDSDYARVVGRSNSLGAYLKVWDAWLRYGDDWLLDPVMPVFSTRTGAKLSDSVARTRLLGVCTTRSWESGDVDEMWAPTLGFVFKNPAPGVAQPMGHDDPFHIQGYGTWNVSAATLAFFADRRLRPAFMLLPFAGYEYTSAPAQASPLMTVPSDGLTFYDQAHMTESGRGLATQRILEGIERAGLIK